MVIELVWVGKTNAKWLEEGIGEYVRRLGHYGRLTVSVIPELKNAKSLRPEQIRTTEGELILARIDAADHLVLLDAAGQVRDSEELADWLQKAILRAPRRLVIVVGGAYGFSEAVYQRANERLSLSRLTFSHQMVRLIFVEQLYRAHTILAGEPYHHK